jgi:predicted phage-related endonuclease
MKTITYQDRESWLKDRKTKITGSSAKDIVSPFNISKEMIIAELEAQKIEHKKSATKAVLLDLLDDSSKEALKNTAMEQAPRKIGFYKLLAERLAIPDEYEDMMERGNALEKDAIARFEEEEGKKVNTDLVMWVREDNDSIALSPDGFIGETEAVEVKCLASEIHLKAIIENEIPDEYHFQTLQYFIVNDKLEKLHFVMYDPRITSRSYYCFVLYREDMQEEVDQYLAYQKKMLEEVNRLAVELSF